MDSGTTEERSHSSSSSSSSPSVCSPKYAMHKVLALVHLHHRCEQGMPAHQQLSVSAKTMCASGWARGASEDMVARAMKTCSLRVVAMLQSKLKKRKMKRDQFALGKCRFMLSKRGSSGSIGSSVGSSVGSGADDYMKASPAKHARFSR